MMHDGFTLPPGWMDWFVVVGYLGFTLFVIWGVLNSKSNQSR